MARPGTIPRMLPADAFRTTGSPAWRRSETYGDNMLEQVLAQVLLLPRAERAELRATLDQLDATEARVTPEIERTQGVKDEEAARRWLEEFDALAAEIDAAWQGDMSATDAVKEQRRDL